MALHSTDLTCCIYIATCMITWWLHDSLDLCKNIHCWTKINQVSPPTCYFKSGEEPFETKMGSSENRIIDHWLIRLIRADCLYKLRWFDWIKSKFLEQKTIYPDNFVGGDGTMFRHDHYHYNWSTWRDKNLLQVKRATFLIPTKRIASAKALPMILAKPVSQLCK